MTGLRFRARAQDLLAKPGVVADCYWVYILASRRRTLYTGTTNDLRRRIDEHRRKVASRFTRRYEANRLVYFESTSDPLSAIAREKQIKSWDRRKKVVLIEKGNPDWTDLSVGWFDGN